MKLFSYFTPKTPYILVYMLQQFEYNPSKFLNWIFTYPDLSNIQKRGKLELTARAKLMLAIGYFIWIINVFFVVYNTIIMSVTAIIGLIMIPNIVIFSLFISDYLLQSVVVNPAQNKEITKAKQKLKTLKGVRIAVIGSFGKTTMKDLLNTVLSEGKKVAVTPGNKNVLISHARWINRDVDEDKEVLVFEYGESEPGDINKLANFSKPSIAVVTGIAPVHMDSYPNLNSIAKDFACISDFVKTEDTYINNQELLTSKIQGNIYSSSNIGKWETNNVSTTFEGTNFTLTNGDESLKIHTGLLGIHNIGPIIAVIAIAKKLGLKNEQIITGVAKTLPFEHRMEPRQLQGAWIIDDTYNGNIEGMRAGLALLKELPGKRKIYVTPGLVDQGNETDSVHLELGNLISATNLDKVVLMKNSVTDIILKGLKGGNYSGEIVIESNPLEYYSNLEHYLAAGDVLMLQNDWPDSYK